MHAIASVLMPLLLSPLNWILILIIIPFVVKNDRVKKSCRITAFILFILFSNQWLLNAYARFWDPKPKDVTADKPYSCGIVLGGFGEPDENGNGYFDIGADRFIQTVKLYKLGKIQHIIISGGNGKDVDKDFKEGAWAKGQMMIMGLPGNDIFYEDLSGNTAENATNTKHILDSTLFQPPYLLITSAYHVPRAVQIFKNAGMDVTGYPCNYLAGTRKFNLQDIIPQPETLVAWNDYLKETVGYCYYYLKRK
jgi:uncharacterized SAM-binding protein YcdF (DUF218 family)